MRSVTIQGRPIPLKRPRFGLGTVYDSQAEIRERSVREIQAQDREFPISDPVKISISFFMPIPKSYSKIKRTKLINQPHTSRPDIDNLIKFYLDVCNGILYDDDAQIYNINASKVYSMNPRTEITITEETENEPKP